MTDELVKLEQQHIERIKQLKDGGLSGRQKATLLRQLAVPSQSTTAADLLISGFDPMLEPWLEWSGVEWSGVEWSSTLQPPPPLLGRTVDSPPVIPTLIKDKRILW
jgi:hypothetical protein